METSLKRNLYYNGILTGAHYVFPLIVYPYVSRVLEVGNIGIVGFIDSVATYFILFSMMGISTLGVREIARCGDDRNRRKSVFLSLLWLHGIVTAIAVAAMIAVTYCVRPLHFHLHLMWVGICKLIFNLFLIEWFYRGIEDFRFITYRSLVIRGLYVLSVFIFVKNEQDTFVYYFLTMTVVAATALVNMTSSRKFLAHVKVKINLRPFIRPFFYFGAYELLMAAYTTLNTVFLGFVSTDDEVGYYATATKLMAILTGIYISFSGVMLPRMSSLIAQEDYFQYRNYFKKTLKIIFLFSVPVIVLVELFASEVIFLLSGPGYEGAITPIRIMIPALLITGLEQLITVQLLMPMGKEKYIFLMVMSGAVVGVTLNLLLVPSLGAIGSAWVWTAAETTVLAGALLSLLFLKKKEYSKNHNQYTGDSDAAPT